MLPQAMDRGNGVSPHEKRSVPPVLTHWGHKIDNVRGSSGEGYGAKEACGQEHDGDAQRNG
jgi:hypothetical protein